MPTNKLKSSRLIAIVGEARSGKTTFAKLLTKALNTQYEDTSTWLINTETERFKYFGEEVPGKEEFRPYLIALGNAVCKNDPGFLIKQALLKANIIVGIRRQSELEAARELDMLVLFIETQKENLDNFEIDPKDCDLIIRNYGSEEDLAFQVNALAPSLCI